MAAHLKEIIAQFETPDLKFKSEDGGMALIVDFGQEEDMLAGRHDPDCGIWLQLISYDESLVHEDANRLRGRRVRVTVELMP